MNERFFEARRQALADPSSETMKRFSREVLRHGEILEPVDDFYGEKGEEFADIASRAYVAALLLQQRKVFDMHDILPDFFHGGSEKYVLGSCVIGGIDKNSLYALIDAFEIARPLCIINCGGYGLSYVFDRDEYGYAQEYHIVRRDTDGEMSVDVSYFMNGLYGDDYVHIYSGFDMSFVDDFSRISDDMSYENIARYFNDDICDEEEFNAEEFVKETSENPGGLSAITSYFLQYFNAMEFDHYPERFDNSAEAEGYFRLELAMEARGFLE